MTLEPFPKFDPDYIDPEWPDYTTSSPQQASPLPPFPPPPPPPPPPPSSVPYRYPSPLQVSSSDEQLDDDHYRNALEKGSYRLIPTDPTLRWSYWVHWEPVNKPGSEIELEAQMTWTGPFDMLALPELPVHYEVIGLGRLRELYKDRAIPLSILKRLTPDEGQKGSSLYQRGSSTSNIQTGSQSVQTSEYDRTIGSSGSGCADTHSEHPSRFDTKPENTEVPYSVSATIHSFEAPSAPPAPTI